MDKTAPLFSSSIGQKIISAITGLFLIAFLVVHLSGNLLLFKNDAGEAFNAYAQANASSILIRSIEVVLFAGFLIHIYWGIRVWLFNRRARRKGYIINRPSENSALFSRIMFISGLLVLLFLVIHLKTFWVPIRFQKEDILSEFALVQTVFQNPFYVLFYLACMVLLGYHLRQGFQSAFQTVGIRSFWRRAIEMAGVVFWLIIPLGFALMPLYFFLLKGAS